MKPILTSILPLVILLGCASPSLVDRMKAQGVTYDNTCKIVLRDSEAGFGADVSVEIVDNFLIQEIWDTIYQSRPHDLWCMCGYSRIEFFTGPSDAGPRFTLLSNEAGTVLLEETSDRFRCPGLHGLVRTLLEDEYKKKANKTTGVDVQ